MHLKINIPVLIIVMNLFYTENVPSCSVSPALPTIPLSHHTAHLSCLWCIVLRAVALFVNYVSYYLSSILVILF